MLPIPNSDVYNSISLKLHDAIYHFRQSTVDEDRQYIATKQEVFKDNKRSKLGYLVEQINIVRFTWQTN